MVDVRQTLAARMDNIDYIFTTLAAIHGLRGVVNISIDLGVEPSAQSSKRHPPKQTWNQAWLLY